MDTLAFEHHLTSPQGQGHTPAGAHSATVGGGSCCDRIRFSVSLRDGVVEDAGFDAKGCGAA
ncbi:MAG: iron-sulfur cluster assembly scaffold protein, partial [Solirubrobacteraceae bacterium]